MKKKYIKPKIEKFKLVWYMTAFEYIKSLPYVPASIERRTIQASNSEKRRWLLNKAVRINNTIVGPDDEIELPVWDLVFFPNSLTKRTTMV